jgi:hypothetical protein
MRIGDVEIISMLISASASAENMSAATPGWVFMPAPTRETLAIPSSVVYPAAPISSMTPCMTCLAWGTSALGTVKEMSVEPS